MLLVSYSQANNLYNNSYLPQYSANFSNFTQSSYHRTSNSFSNRKSNSSSSHSNSTIIQRVKLNNDSNGLASKSYKSTELEIESLKKLANDYSTKDSKPTQKTMSKNYRASSSKSNNSELENRNLSSVPNASSKFKNYYTNGPAMRSTIFEEN